MYNLTEPFVMPEKILLRTQQGNVTAVGSCHMAVPQSEEMERTAIGSCHMAIPQSDNNDFIRRQYRGTSMHREVVVLG